MAVQAWTIGKDEIPEADHWSKIIRRRQSSNGGEMTDDRELNISGMRESMSYMSGYIIVQEDDETPIMMAPDLFNRDYEWV